MSNTIIMYENGKAVGGEGHPTNADEITFNNEDTDLVSEEVESAIKEVNAKFDRGSVSVTANGNKTYGTLFNELYALVDMTKINRHSVLEIYSGIIIGIEQITSNSIVFAVTTLNSTNNALTAIRVEIMASGSKFVTFTVTTTPAASATDLSNNTAASGTTLTLEY